MRGGSGGERLEWTNARPLPWTGPGIRAPVPSWSMHVSSVRIIAQRQGNGARFTSSSGAGSATADGGGEDVGDRGWVHYSIGRVVRHGRTTMQTKTRDAKAKMEMEKMAKRALSGAGWGLFATVSPNTTFPNTPAADSFGELVIFFSTPPNLYAV